MLNSYFNYKLNDFLLDVLKLMSTSDEDNPNEDYESTLEEIREALISGLQTENFEDYDQLFDSLSFYTHE